MWFRCRAKRKDEKTCTTTKGTRGCFEYGYGASIARDLNLRHLIAINKKIMKTKLLYSEDGRRTFGLVLQKGMDLIPSIKSFSRNNNISGSQFTSIGCLSKTILAVRSSNSTKRKKMAIRGVVDIISLTGYIGLEEGKMGVECNAILTDSKGRVLGGRLVSAQVDPRLEIILEESPKYLQRKIDSKTGFALLCI